MSQETTAVESAIQDGLQQMRDAGCAFADARLFEDDACEFFLLYDGNPEQNTAQLERGLGVRVLYDGAWGFAATADLTALPACFERALANSRAAARLPGFRKDPGTARPTRGSYQSPVERDPFEVPLRGKARAAAADRCRAAGAARRAPLRLCCNFSAATCITGTARAPRWSAGR